MSEKLTADGTVPIYKNGQETFDRRGYVWLPRAQALADLCEVLQSEVDAQHNAVANAHDALLECRSRIGRLEMELQASRAGHRTTQGCYETELSARKMAEHERDEVRAELEAIYARRGKHEWYANERICSQRHANARMQREYDALNQKYETARRNMIRDVAEARKERDKARADANELKNEMDRVARAIYPHKEERFTCSVDFAIEEIEKLWRERDEARDLLRNHGIGLSAPSLDDAIRQALQAVVLDRDTCKQAIRERDEARARAEAAEAVAEQWKVKMQAIWETLGRGSFTVNEIRAALADTPKPQPTTSKFNRLAETCNHQPHGMDDPNEEEPSVDDEPDTTPVALDPALREPMRSVSDAAEWFTGDRVNFVRLPDANDRIAALVAAYDTLAARHDRAVRLAGTWHQAAMQAAEKLEGEPERTKAVVAAKLRDIGDRWLDQGQTAANALYHEADNLAHPPKGGAE